MEISRILQYIRNTPSNNQQVNLSDKIINKPSRVIGKSSNLLSGTFDRRMIDGEVSLPKTLKLSVDVQEYQLNWTNKHDRRNTQFSTVCSVDQDTRYILGMCANYDKEADSFLINKEASMNGDALKPEAFREQAQYWLTTDEFLGGRKLNQRLGFQKSQDVLQQIKQELILYRIK